MAMIPPSKRAAVAGASGRRSTLAGAVQVLPSHAPHLRTRTGSMTSIENVPGGGSGIMSNSPSLGASRSLSGVS